MLEVSENVHQFRLLHFLQCKMNASVGILQQIEEKRTFNVLDAKLSCTRLVLGMSLVNRDIREIDLTVKRGVLLMQMTK